MTRLTDGFSEAYKNLNAAQKEAVDSIEGPVMVVAGPGTGKTQILTLRIANILKQTDTAPENILALTFTENAAANMRQRLAKLIGSPAYRVAISTFHSFCNDIIKNYPEEFPRIIGSASIQDIDQIKIIEEIVETMPLKLLRPFGDPLLYVKPILGSINELKREGITPLEFNQLIKDKNEAFDHIPDLRHDKGAHKGKVKSGYEKLRRQIDKNAELATVYEAYEQRLTAKKFYDYSDMIMEVLRELRTNESLLLSLQEEHQYILVDEHQDTNNAQNKVLELIGSFHDNPNLFIVGDDKQAIFRFQGASLANFYYFKDRYKEAKLIFLTNNYRSTQVILDQAHALLPSETNLKANRPIDHPVIEVATLPTGEMEMYFVAKSIKQQLEQGVPPEEIAVLYRNNNDAFEAARVLNKLTIPLAIESDDNLLGDLDVRKFLILFRAIFYFNDSEALAEALHIDWLNVSPLTTYQLVAEAGKAKRPLIEQVRVNLPELFARFEEWNKAAHNLELLPFAQKVLKESRALDAVIVSSNARERIETISSLFKIMGDMAVSHPGAQLKEFLDFVEVVKKHQVLLKNKKRNGVAGKVRLMTVHKAKGLEFEYVYIVGAFNGHFGGRTNRDKLKLLSEVYSLVPARKEEAETDQGTDDERRLFYVALTRSKKKVTISYSTMSSSGREQVPSQFISELRPELLEWVDISEAVKEFEANKAMLLNPDMKEGSDLKDPAYLGELFREQGLSVTALNNYLACPWQYFYRNLIRLPAVPEKHQAYGIAVHAALNEVFKHGKERDITKESLLASFEQSLRAEPLNPKDFQEVLERGSEALTGWFLTYQNNFNINVLTEFKVKGVELTPDIKLVGNLDKIEFAGDDNRVNVVDYKTGKPKSRNELLGETKDSEGNYYRQLVFYKLLLQLFEDGKYDMVSGEIDFIEPTDTKKYKKEKFDIAEADVLELTEEIKRVADEILTLAFWDTTCDNKDCEYCALRQLMK